MMIITCPTPRPPSPNPPCALCPRYRPDSALRDLQLVLAVLAASPELCTELRAAEAAFNAYARPAAGQARRSDGEYGDMVPWWLDQVRPRARLVWLRVWVGGWGGPCVCACVRGLQQEGLPPSCLPSPHTHARAHVRTHTCTHACARNTHAHRRHLGTGCARRCHKWCG